MTERQRPRVHGPAEDDATTFRAAAAPVLSCAQPTVLDGYEDGENFGRYRVNNDVWQQIGKQTMRVCSEHEWLATCTQSGDPSTGVKTYPDSGVTYTDWSTDPGPRVDSFTHLAATFAHTSPAGKYSCDWAFDLFFNVNIGKPTQPFLELMVLPQWANVDFPTPQFRAVVIGNRTYDVYHSEGPNGRFVQMYFTEQVHKGTVHWLPIFAWLEAHGLLHADDLLAFIQYGVEVLTTYGKPVTFALTAFTVTDTRSAP